MKKAERVKLERELQQQLAWIDEKGSTREGYRAHYTNPRGDADAIFDADIEQLHKLQRALGLELRDVRTPEQKLSDELGFAMSWTRSRQETLMGSVDRIKDRLARMIEELETQKQRFLWMQRREGIDMGGNSYSSHKPIAFVATVQHTVLWGLANLSIDDLPREAFELQELLADMHKRIEEFELVAFAEVAR